MKICKLAKVSKILFLSIAFIAIVIIACNKSSMYQSQTQPSTNTIALSEDSVFISLVFDIKDYNNVLSNNSGETIMDQKDFEFNFNNAVKNNDPGSKKLIANTMGYSNEEDFWNLRNKMVNKIYLLSKRYDFKNISMNELNNIAISQINKSKMLFLNNKKSNALGGSTDLQSCIEYFKNCSDQANATYAAEQVVCVSAAELGWTPIGAVMFIACEAASNYHLYINERTCRTNLKYCK